MPNGAGIRVHPQAPVLALDIDGTLGAYHHHFMWFAGLYLQEEVRANWYPGYRGEFSNALGLKKDIYRQIKLAYRQGGMKRSLPALGPDLMRDIQYIRSQNIQVWICTTRPWNRLDNIDPDTTFWIERTLGRVDGVIYGEEKYEDLIDIVGKDRILGVADDLPENIIAARDLGLNTLIRRGDHNAWWFVSGEAPEKSDSFQIGITSADITSWADRLICDYQEGMK